MPKRRDGLRPVPVVDATFGDGIDWTTALSGHGGTTRKLLTAFDARVQAGAGGPIGAMGLRAVAKMLNGLLGGHYLKETRALADLADDTTGRVLVANLAYDLSAGAAGCSTFATPLADSVLHARNLDWEFPRQLLRKHTVVVRVRGAPCGDYALVTWPGFFGGLTAMAKHRFSVSVNYVEHSGSGGVGALLKRGIQGYWPVPWLVRQALDECEDWAAAVEFLKKAPVLAPVLFTVAGTRPGDAVVIERTPDEGAKSRVNRGASVWITNHYAWTKHRGHCNEDVMDSGPRFACLKKELQRPPTDPDEALALLDLPALFQDTGTQQQVVMNAAQGRLWVRVPGGALTEVEL